MGFLIPKAFLGIALSAALPLDAQTPVNPTELPNAKLLGQVPGSPRKINNFPTAAAVSADGHFAVFLHSGYGAYTSRERQSLTVLNLETNELRDFPDDRLASGSKQTYFLGLAFSLDGSHLYASIASLTDPLGRGKGSTGNGVAVYSFENGQIAPERFLKISPRMKIPAGIVRRQQYNDVTYPAGLSVAKSGGVERILVACNNSDEAVLLNASDGQIIQRFDLSAFKRIPASLPYTTVMTSDGKRGYVSLWNASAVAELDLANGNTTRVIPMSKPKNPLEGGSHPTALVLSHDGSRLYLALTNRDEIAVIDTATGEQIMSLSTKLPGQKYGGSDPQSLALSADGELLFSANAISDSVAVFPAGHLQRGGPTPLASFIPTEWYPTVVAVAGGDLLIGSAKGRGSGPNPVALKKKAHGDPDYPYNPAMTNGSLARIPLAGIENHLEAWTAQVSATNAAQGNTDRIPFVSGQNKIHHVIYIIKENRTYDQVFGDLTEANGDPSLTLYGEDITPNEHRLARQFGILDNFYDSGDVSGDGHIWSTAASISDYVEKTWPIAYRSKEHTYDSEGQFLGGVAIDDDLPYAGEPTGGFLWKNFAAHAITYRHYGEYVASKWCNGNFGDMPSPPEPSSGNCKRSVVKKGEALPVNVGDPRGGPSPYPWPIPVLARNVAAQEELRGHFDPLFPDFEVAYPDQLRVDEFLNEFDSFVAARDDKTGKDPLPQFMLVRLPNDHTAGGRKGQPRPTASVADNDLAIGRLVDAVSHTPYWDDTAILILEDDAQDGPDHVDSHRSTALVVSKYSPLPQPASGHSGAFVDHSFYTTINMVRTIEALLGAPPMNANDARAAVMAPLFGGPGTQPAYSADYRNRDNGLIYEMNTKDWKEGADLDFQHADAADNVVLNRFLWQDRMGDIPMPAPQHNVIPKR
jgi:DNA-binding beta-propeller fold protein YncE